MSQIADTAVKVATFASLLQSLASPVFSDGLLWLARAADGEGAAMFGDRESEVVTWIVHTALNRLVSPGFPDSIEEVVRSGFFGHRHAPDPDPEIYAAVAKSVLRYALEGDVTGGCYFMLSYHDLQSMSLSRSGGHCFDALASGFGLCFFKEWPIAGGSGP